jgi:hypothetical protein
MVFLRGEAMAIIEVDAALGEPIVNKPLEFEPVISSRQIEL